jgi:hypothetical protein
VNIPSAVLMSAWSFTTIRTLRSEPNFAFGKNRNYRSLHSTLELFAVEMLKKYLAGASTNQR